VKFVSRNAWKKLPIKRALAVLSKKDRKKLTIIICIQILMGCLDLLGVVALGALGALSINGLATNTEINQSGTYLGLFNFSNISLEIQAVFLGVFAAAVLVLKTILSILITRRTFFFLSHRGAQVSADLIKRLLAQSLLEVQKRTSQETLFVVTQGVQGLMLGILAMSVQIIADLALVLIMFTGLFFLDPLTALASVALFAFIGYVLHIQLRVRAHKLGEETYQLSVVNNEKILEVLNSYRETMVRNRAHYYAIEISKLRYRMSDAVAEFTFMPYISKYVIESTIVVGLLLLSAFKFLSSSPSTAVATIAVFLAASSRIAPAILRIQQGMLTVRNSFGSANQTLNLLDDFRESDFPEPSNQMPDFVYAGFKPHLEVKNVYFRFPDTATFELHDLNLTIPAGSSAAIVGPSGAGKSTLVDLILGVITPNSGFIEISATSPEKASKIWPGAISYVPQNVFISSGTIRENVGLGYPKEFLTDHRVQTALRQAQLLEEINQMPDKLDSDVGEQGSKISGGQRQRLGIARSLFTNPLFLVLDEATSALDGQTEMKVSDALNSLKGQVTLLVVAHRLSTVRKVDQVIYMNEGKILAVGTFQEVRSKIPDFDEQASLMGL
jgi:ABC-type multidrug transport system fused ATPase/permease subunit